MASLINFPEQILHPAYRYLRYGIIVIDGIDYDSSAGEVPYGAVIDIIPKCGVYLPTNTDVKATQLTTTTLIVGANYTVYGIDLQNIIQDFLEVDLNTIGGGGEYIDRLSELLIGGNVKGVYLDGDGLRNFSEAAAITDLVHVLNATMAHDSFEVDYGIVGAFHFNLNLYTPYAIFPDWKWLTNKPDAVEVCRNDSEFIHYWSIAVNGAKFTQYNGNGNVIKKDYVYLTAYDAGGTSSNRSFGVGPRNYKSKFGSEIDANCAYYTFELGLLVDNEPEPYFVSLMSRKYVLTCDECFCREHERIHFLNRFGKVDVVSVRKSESTVKTKSSSFKKSLGIPHTLRDFGQRKQGIDTTTPTDYVLEGYPLEFMQEFATSPLHWIERTANYLSVVTSPTANAYSKKSKEGYVPVLIEDGEFKTEKDFGTMNFTLLLANETPIQRT